MRESFWKLVEDDGSGVVTYAADLSGSVLIRVSHVAGEYMHLVDNARIIGDDGDCRIEMIVGNIYDN